MLVCSTFKDLKEERLAVRDVITDLANNGYNIQWECMEGFGSYASSPLRISQESVEDADFVILLVADYYGTVPPDEQYSITYSEYDIIRRDKIPCLVYLADQQAVHQDPRVEEFRKMILQQQELTVSTYVDKDDLARRVLVRWNTHQI